MAAGDMVLVVDDEPLIRETVADILRDEGYRVQTAGNGAAALDAVARERPAAVLLVMRMPVLDGWGFCSALRERGIVLPIAVMTAASSAEAWRREIGGQACLAKPFELTDVLETVERLVGLPPA
jgi:DNA-binding response OmpR family regulator